MAGTTRWGFFRLKNWMLFSNMIANAIGVAVVIFLTGHTGLVSAFPEAYAVIHVVSMIFLPLSFMVPVLLVIGYERPIRRYLNQEQRGDEIPQERVIEARRPGQRTHLQRPGLRNPLPEVFLLEAGRVAVVHPYLMGHLYFILESVRPHQHVTWRNPKGLVGSPSSAWHMTFDRSGPYVNPSIHPEVL